MQVAATMAMPTPSDSLNRDFMMSALVAEGAPGDPLRVPIVSACSPAEFARSLASSIPIEGCAAGTYDYDANAAMACVTGAEASSDAEPEARRVFAELAAQVGAREPEIL